MARHFEWLVKKTMPSRQQRDLVESALASPETTITCERERRVLFDAMKHTGGYLYEAIQNKGKTKKPPPEDAFIFFYKPESRLYFCHRRGACRARPHAFFLSLVDSPFSSSQTAFSPGCGFFSRSGAG